ncbi:MAG: tyrosine-type recombinase/integrase [Anaerolineae bacterium]|nr:tyrosine-type recombinase/integrase [Anaerolineae bacterium]
MIPLKFSQALQGFFLNTQARKLSIHTIQDYENTLITKFQPFLEKDYLVEDITSRHIEEFLAAQTTITKKTTLNYHTGLSAFWTWAIREKIAREHVVHAVPAPVPEQRDIVPYNEQDVRTMLRSLERSRAYRRRGQRTTTNAARNTERNRAIILLLLDTGIRNEELCKLKLHDLDKRNQRIHVFGKGSRERHVPVSARTLQALWRYLTLRPNAKLNEPLFLLETGKPFNRHRLLDLLQTIGARAGVKDVTVHRFRHACAIEYLRNGGDPYTLQRLLGHSTLDMVKRYLAIVQADIENAHRRASPVDNWAL